LSTPSPPPSPHALLPYLYNQVRGEFCYQTLEKLQEGSWHPQSKYPLLDPFDDITSLQDMEGLKAGVKSMEDRKAALEGDLWAKEAEIEQIK